MLELFWDNIGVQIWWVIIDNILFKYDGPNHSQKMYDGPKQYLESNFKI